MGKFHAEKTLICSFCGEKFSKSVYLSKHIYVKHTFEECDICGKTIPTPTRKKHLDRHKNLKKFQCGICDKTFFQSNQVLSHLFTHGNAKEYVCYLCSYGTCDFRILKKHLETNHGVTKTWPEIRKLIPKSKPDHDESNIIRINQPSSLVQ